MVLCSTLLLAASLALSAFSSSGSSALALEAAPFGLLFFWIAPLDP